MNPEEIAAIRNELDEAIEQGLRPAPQVLALVAAVERLTEERDDLGHLYANSQKEASYYSARLDKVRGELSHARMNGHRLSKNCQGVSPGERVPAVRIDYIEAALDGSDQ